MFDLDKQDLFIFLSTVALGLSQPNITSIRILSQCQTNLLLPLTLESQFRSPFFCVCLAQLLLTNSVSIFHRHVSRSFCRSWPSHTLTLSILCIFAGMGDSHWYQGNLEQTQHVRRWGFQRSQGPQILLLCYLWLCSGRKVRPAPLGFSYLCSVKIRPLTLSGLFPLYMKERNMWMGHVAETSCCKTPYSSVFVLSIESITKIVK